MLVQQSGARGIAALLHVNANVNVNIDNSCVGCSQVLRYTEKAS